MTQKDKTKEGLIEDIRLLQKRIAELERVDAEHKKTKQIATEAREYAEGIVDTVRESLIVLDADLKVISTNKSFYQTFKVNPQETEGQFIYDLGNRQWDIPKLRQLLEDILPKNSVFNNYEIEHDFETIGSKTMLLNARCLYGKANERQKILLAIEDITERKKAEQIIKETQEKLIHSLEKLAVLGKLAGSLSHELRNPLGAIKDAIYYLTIPGISIDKKTEEEYFDIIRRQIQLAVGIIAGILDFVRPKELELQKSKINKAIDESLSEIRIPENIKIEKDYKQDIEILFDPLLIKRAFSNIITNSIQAIKERGRIKITTEKEKESLKIVFEDNGEGIAKEDLGKIFDPLFSKKIRGVGLGLTVVESVIKRHKGSIHVESEVGKGTTVVVRLPTKEEE